MAFLHNLPSKTSFITFLLLFGSSFNTPTRMVHLSWAGTVFPSFDIGYGKVCCTLVRDLSTRACSLTRAHTQVESSRTEIKQAPPGFGSPHYIFLSQIPSFFPPSFLPVSFRSFTYDPSFPPSRTFPTLPFFLRSFFLPFSPSLVSSLVPSLIPSFVPYFVRSVLAGLFFVFYRFRFSPFTGFSCLH